MPQASLKSYEGLDHDFHSAWGTQYVTQVARGAIWHDYVNNSEALEARYHELLLDYTVLFSQFFQEYIPISFHSHVSDASSPATIVSLLKYLAGASVSLGLKSSIAIPSSLSSGRKIEEGVTYTVGAFPGMLQPIKEFYGWREQHIAQPRFAVVHGAYGAAYGPLAHLSQEWELSLGSGPQPIVINLQGLTTTALVAQLTDAKAAGCVALIAEMVSAVDGSVISPKDFENLQKACLATKLPLIIDEALTAIRCGAPFSFQRPEYNEALSRTGGPDLVFFGKGMGLSGIAVKYNGQFLRELGFSSPLSRRLMTAFWRDLVSQPVQLPALLAGMDILKAASGQRWPDRSREVGTVVRRFLKEHQVEDVRGLEAMIFVDQRMSKQFPVNAAYLRRSPWARWIPKLDRAMANYDLVSRYVFGVESLARRRQQSAAAVARGTMPHWCYVCSTRASDPDWGDREWCQDCYLASCLRCRDEFASHPCLRKRLKQSHI